MYVCLLPEFDLTMHIWLSTLYSIFRTWLLYRYVIANKLTEQYLNYHLASNGL